MDWPLDASAPNVLKLPGEATIPWAVFDSQWYRRHYARDAGRVDGDEPAALLHFYLEIGQRLGHSPNIFFDEAWHRQRYPNIAAAVEAGTYASAFDAYCRRGCLDRSPHWLFDELGYRHGYPDLTDEVLARSHLVNRYHHYLAHGCQEGRIGHPLFDQAIYLANFDAAQASVIIRHGTFCHFLERMEAGEPELSTSVYFEPSWYMRRYPEVAVSVRKGALHHYCCNTTPTEFDPLPDFAEAHYRAHDGGPGAAVDLGYFRNGYAHFLQFGARELRSPTASIDLRAYAAQPRVRQDLQDGVAPNAFAHWLQIGKREGLLPADPMLRQALDPLPRDSFHRAAMAVLPATGRFGYSFECTGMPDVSVVMVVRDRFANTMAALGSLRSTFSGDIELILVDCGSTDETQAIGDYIAGARPLRF